MKGFVIAALFILPPGFRARAVPGDPFARGIAEGAGGEPGTVLWAVEDGRCRAAVMLAPDQAITERTLTALGVLALYDALAVLAPPQVPIEVADGACLIIDGGRAAWVRAAVGAGSPPEWAVLAVEVALATAAENPGEAPEDTCLAEEGFGVVTPDVLLPGFCRHLLAWIEVWRDDGAAGLDRAVVERCVGRLVRA